MSSKNGCARSIRLFWNSFEWTSKTGHISFGKGTPFLFRFTTTRCIIRNWITSTTTLVQKNGCWRSHLPNTNTAQHLWGIHRCFGRLFFHSVSVFFDMSECCWRGHQQQPGSATPRESSEKTSASAPASNSFNEG